MSLFYKSKFIFILIIMPVSLALIQLNHDGFTPPIAVPFGISMENALKLQGSVIWVDARPDKLFRASHIPGALNLNRENWDQALAQFFEAYKPGRPVIVYCSPYCSESEEIASRIRDLGLDQILVLQGGFDAPIKAASNL
jgi:rhodanese-related sulfurtransferase